MADPTVPAWAIANGSSVVSRGFSNDGAIFFTNETAMSMASSQPIAAFGTPNRQSLAVGKPNGTGAIVFDNSYRVWDVSFLGGEHPIFTTDTISAMAISPDGSKLVTIHNNGTQFSTYRVQSGELISTFDCPYGAPNAPVKLVFRPDGQSFVGPGPNVWTLDGTPLVTNPTFLEPFTLNRFGGIAFQFTDFFGTLQGIDLNSNVSLWSSQYSDQRAFFDLFKSADSSRLLFNRAGVVQGSRRLQFVDAGNGHPISELPVSDNFNLLGVSPTENRLVYSDQAEDGRLGIKTAGFEPETGTLANGSPLTTNDGEFAATPITYRGTPSVGYETDRRYQIRRASDGKLLKTVPRPNMTFSVSPDGRYCGFSRTTSRNKVIFQLRTVDGQALVGSCELPFMNLASQIATDGTVMIRYVSGVAVFKLETVTQTLQQSAFLPVQYGYDCELAPDGASFTVHLDAKIATHDAADGHLIATIKTNQPGVPNSDTYIRHRYLADSRLVVQEIAERSGGLGYRLRLYARASNVLLATVSGSKTTFHTDVYAAMSPDGRLAVFSSRPIGKDDDPFAMNLELVDVASGRVLRIFGRPLTCGGITDVGFSPDGKWILVAGPTVLASYRTSDLQ